jgi:two-component system sensor histidine kinase CpxA
VKVDKAFLSHVSHEVRSPLARIQAALALLERRVGGKELEYVGDIREEVDLISRAITDLAILAEAELHAAAIELVPTAIDDVVGRARQAELPPEAVVEIAVPAGLAARAHPDYLLRAVANVIRNAVRRQGGTLQIAAREFEGEIIVSIADSGANVPEAGLASLFDPFSRADPARDGRSGGNGLDLAVARSCIAACDGVVEARNRAPRGLVVTIRLPAAV